MDQSQLEKDRKEKLHKTLQERGRFISIKAKIFELVEPRILKLQLENISNVRNSIIIAGALASMSLLSLGQNSIILPTTTRVLVFVSVFAFIMSIFLYSLNLDFNLGKGLKEYRNLLKTNTDTTNVGENILNDYLDGKIDESEKEKRLEAVYRDIEYTKIRTQPDEQRKKVELSVIFAVAGNVFFYCGLFTLAIAIIIYLI